MTIGQELEVMCESIGGLYDEDDLGPIEFSFQDFKQIYSLGRVDAQ